jgi:hypothetical protein
VAPPARRALVLLILALGWGDFKDLARGTRAAGGADYPHVARRRVRDTGGSARWGVGLVARGYPQVQHLTAPVAVELWAAAGGSRLKCLTLPADSSVGAGAVAPLAPAVATMARDGC